MPQVSVVIPVYNIAQHLRECLDSVATQTLRDIEIICVDDGSTDDSPKILAEYAAKDTRFHVITQQNAGPGAARNAGMAIASGEYLIFLDSDDWFEPTMLEDMLRRARNTNADVTICGSESFDSETRQVLQSEWMLRTEFLPGEVFAPKEISSHIFQLTHGWPWDKLYRTEYIRKNGYSYPNFRNSQDLVFVYPSLMQAKTIAVLSKVLIYHRFNRKTSVSNTRIEYLTAPYEAAKMLKSYMTDNNLNEHYGDSFTNWVAGFLIWHVTSIVPKDTQKQLLKTLREEWFAELGVSERPIGRFEGNALRAKLALVRYAPYPVFCAAVCIHNKRKSHTEGV